MNHWSFKSTANDFDGHRIVQEAMEAVEGASLIHITRKGRTLTLTTAAFKDRAAKVGYQLAWYNLYNSIPNIDDRGDLAPKQSSKHNPFYYYITGYSIDDVRKLMSDVKALEAKQERTTVAVL